MIKLKNPPNLPFDLSDAELWTNASDVEYFSSEKKYEYFISKRNDILFIDPTPVDKLDEIYPSNYYSYSNKSITLNSNKKSIVELIKYAFDNFKLKLLLSELKTSQISILDVGGGNCELLDLAKNIDKRVNYTELLDLDEESISQAIIKGHSGFKGKIEDFETEKKYDLIFLVNLIEHVYDPLLILQKLQKLLNPGGLIYIKTPNWKSLDERIFRNHNWVGYHCPRHWILFSKKSFTRLANKANLIIHKFNYEQGATFWASSIICYLKEKRILKNRKNIPPYMSRLYMPLCGLFAFFDIFRGVFFRTSQMSFTLKSLRID